MSRPDAAPTRIDPVGAPTRIDGSRRPPHAGERDAGATRLDVATAARPSHADASGDDAGDGDGGGRGHRSVFNLPSDLAARWRIVAPIPAGGAEADLFVVARIADGGEAVAKIYRPGLAPRSQALDRLTGDPARHVVPVFERGHGDGLAWEVMEYCRHGSLRPFLATAAGDVARAEAILRELAPALATLHAAGIIHRDLKPENVLVRTIEPLDLVLADFGIASVADGMHHFTSTSRTVRYAAPEAMTGVISAKADWWSLGMILLEALAGRHPFEGLSEAVVNHQIVTRPVAVDAIHDPAWQALLRGLLLRDPRERWGADEVRRWLDHDPSFDRTAAPRDTGGDLRVAQPYDIEGDRCGTAPELAVALVRHWAHGVRDLARGFVTAWLRDELHDRNLARFVHDLLDDQTLNPDRRLLAFALRVVPDLPLVWKGRSLADDALAAVAHRILAGAESSADDAAWLADVYRQDLASVLPESHPERQRLVDRLERWKARVHTFEGAHAILVEAEHAATAERTKANGFANLDDLMFGNASPHVDGVPVPYAALLAADLSPGALDVVRKRVTAVALEVGVECPWFLTLGSPATLGPEALALLDAATGRARAGAAANQADQARRAAAAESNAGVLLRELEAIVRSCRACERSGVGEPLVRSALREQHTAFHALHATVHDEAHAGPAYEALRRTLQRAALPMHNLAKSLDRIEYLDRVRDVVLGRGAPAVIGALVMLLIVFRSPAVLEFAAIGAVGAIGWYFWTRSNAFDAFEQAIDRLPRPSTPKPKAQG